MVFEEMSLLRWHFSFRCTQRSIPFAGMRGSDKYRLALYSESAFTNSGFFFATVFIIGEFSVQFNRLTILLMSTENLAPDLFSEVEFYRTVSGLWSEPFLSSPPAKPVAVARIFTCYGPHIPTELHYAMGNFIGQARRGQPIVVNSAGPIEDLTLRF